MAIKTLGDNCNNLRVLYFLSKGDKAQKRDENGKGGMAGADLGENFRFESPNETISHIYNKNYQQNSKINIYLPFDTAQENFDDYYENHGSSGLEWRCDGEQIIERVKTVTGSFKGRIQERRTKVLCNDPCLALNANNQFCPDCKPTGRLKFFIREIYHAGFVQCGLLTTSSKNDCIYLKEELNNLYKRWGSLTASPFNCPETFGMIPWVLHRVKQPINRFVGGKIIRKPYYGLAIAPNPDWVKRWLSQMQTSLPQPQILTPRYEEMLRRVKIMLTEYGQLKKTSILPDPELFKTEKDLEIFGKSLSQELTLLYKRALGDRIPDIDRLGFKELQRKYQELVYNANDKF